MYCYLLIIITKKLQLQDVFNWSHASMFQGLESVSVFSCSKCAVDFSHFFILLVSFRPCVSGV